MNTKILLFIPMYNCEKQIVRVLSQLHGDILHYLSEVIVINNRSTDGGEQAVVNYLNSHTFPMPVRLLRNDENYGLGGSQKVAFTYAIEHGFDYVIMLHGDDQGDIANLLPHLKSGRYKKYDCFLGARFMRGSKLQGYSTFRTFGNFVYNILFSIGTRRKIYDLGSGLNMYKTSIMKDQFYWKYKDNLMFNYCMILGSSFYRHKQAFFPIVWREEDQISNVKMLNQAMVVLKLLFSYLINKNKFAVVELRDKIVDRYSAQVIVTSRSTES